MIIESTVRHASHYGYPQFLTPIAHFMTFGFPVWANLVNASMADFWFAAALFVFLATHTLTKFAQTRKPKVIKWVMVVRYSGTIVNLCWESFYR